MRKLFCFFFLITTYSGFSQAVGNVNLNYLYNPQNEIDFRLKLVKTHDQVIVYYSLKTATVQFSAENCVFTWQRRDSFSQRDGNPITPIENKPPIFADGKLTGVLTFPIPDKPWLLVAKISNPDASKSWIYFKTIESNYPVNGGLMDALGPIYLPYISSKTQFVVQGSGSEKAIRASFYKNNFNPASPPFVETESAVDRFLFHDSTFVVRSGDKATFQKQGLYLLQEDSLGTEGFAFRSTNEVYPKYSKVEDLVNPLIYVCAQEEFDELRNAKGDKFKFDKVILDITKDKERAKNFMRSYFRRVELANLYFSSYKEGWKTDRGMIYIIFGTPDEVIKTGQNETWNYKSSRQSFSFVKTGSVYDPDYFVLVRERRFTETWFNTIDMWRKSRF